MSRPAWFPHLFCEFDVAPYAAIIGMGADLAIGAVYWWLPAFCLWVVLVAQGIVMPGWLHPGSGKRIGGRSVLFGTVALWAGFIFACGLTHFTAAATVIVPRWWLGIFDVDATARLVCATVSIPAAILSWRYRWQWIIAAGSVLRAAELYEQGELDV